MVEDVKYLGTALKNQNVIQEEIKSRLTSEKCLLSSDAEPFVFQFEIKNLKVTIYRTIILRVVLYGRENWSPTCWEKRRLRVSENRAMRRIFGSKWDEVTGEWRKLHNEELNDMYCSPNIVRVIKSR